MDEQGENNLYGYITSDELASWSKSFDALMANERGRQLFRHYLKTEYSEENLLFWQACEELKTLSSDREIDEKVRQIYEDYISILSPKEVSIDSKVRDIINQNMIEPNIHTFDEAQSQIYTLMSRDSFPRFLGSELIKKLKDQHTISRQESSS